MNREKKDKIPSMQVSFIDAICIQLYQVRGGWGGPASCPCSSFPRSDQRLCPLADLGRPVGALLPAPGRLPEEPPAVAAFGGGVRAGLGQRRGVTPQRPGKVRVDPPRARREAREQLSSDFSAAFSLSEQTFGVSKQHKILTDLTSSCFTRFKSAGRFRAGPPRRSGSHHVCQEVPSVQSGREDCGGGGGVGRLGSGDVG